MKRTRLIAIVAIIAFLALLLAVFLSFRLVVYVYPAAFETYSSRYSHPSFLNWGYFLVSRSDSDVSFLEKIKKSSIYIYTPYSRGENGERFASYVMVKNGEQVICDLSEEEMYSSFLSSFQDETIGFVYDDSSEKNALLFSSLNALNPSLESITYTERVSVVNEEELISQSAACYAVIITDPLSSSMLYRNTSSRVVMDERYAVAALSLESVISLHYDWDRMIREAFTLDSTSSYYTFSVLH